MIRRYREIREDDRGVAMVWLATTIVLLLGTAGFAVDLGWLYLNASRAQRTVDAAAMAGVVHLPGFPTTADLDARDAGRANGYDICNPSSTGCADEMVTTPLSDNELHVEMRTTVDSFFLAVMGFDTFGITREATAEYVKPVPLGSPSNCFGRDPTSTYCADDPDGFWAAVSGRTTQRQDGDPYSTACFEPNGSSTSCDSWNNEYARNGSYSGYYYAVEVQPGVTDLQIRVYDAGFYNRPHDESTGDSNWSSGDSKEFSQTRFRFHRVDATPHDPTDNPVVSGCDYTLSEDQWENALRDKWGTLCTVNGSITPGIWVFHVETTTTGNGSKHFSIAALAGAGPNPRVYGINDMSIWNNRVDVGGTTELYLVEVSEDHAGSKLELQFFDPGDARDNSWMAVKKPTGSGGYVTPSCDWYSEDYWGNETGSGNGSCSWQTTDTSQADRRVYNNQWITAIVDIPADYKCNSGSDGCFWFMELNLSDPNERTTWRARVIGNPVRLVP